MNEITLDNIILGNLQVIELSENEAYDTNGGEPVTIALVTLAVAIVGGSFAFGFTWGRSDAKAGNTYETNQRTDGYCDLCYPGGPPSE